MSGIRVGEDWQERLHERLRWADAVVVSGQRRVGRFDVVRV